MALDFENSLRRSRIETSRYEFKQGVLRLDNRRKWDDALFERLAETICGIANVQQGHEGYLFVGVADKEADAQRIETLDSVTPMKVGQHHVVGVDREAKFLKISLEAYVQRFVTKLAQQPLSEPLATQIMSGVDTIEYKGLSVIRFLIPGQNDLSYCGDRVFVRKGSSTEEITDFRKVAALVKAFS
ncbi:ATP-binding protein [Streptomyces sp. NPDC004579]|uniref:ATP-binding protein n=1 Tax=Streptomyces sp. NPDC004579 TaxID=3154667 RepID=UPI0033B4B4D6